jgi:hypothetical protein
MAAGVGWSQDGRTLISVSEYLSTPDDPDCHYVEGQVLQRRLAGSDHRQAAGECCFADLFHSQKIWGIQIVPEQRAPVSPSRFRVPEV